MNEVNSNLCRARRLVFYPLPSGTLPKERSAARKALKLMSRYILKAANSLISLIVVLSLCVAGTYAAYALWDNSRIYSAAGNIQADMLKLKPVPKEDGKASFEELLAINPDVCAWITLDNTRVDYPVLQGESNLSYINMDVYGGFALAGSIYLDSRSSSTFGQAYSLLYGHHMENGGMFGDLDLYKSKAFFEENTTGMLILPDRAYNLKIFACLLVKASDDYIFEPERWKADINGLITYAEEKGMYLHEEIIENLKQTETAPILALSTCASEFTDARTIIMAVMEPSQAADQEED